MLAYVFWIHVEPRGVEPVLLLVVEVGRKLNSIIINSYVFLSFLFWREEGRLYRPLQNSLIFFLKRVFSSRPMKTKKFSTT